MRIGFWKMSGAGNDFVLLDGRPERASGPDLARRLCDRRGGIGADGLLVLSRPRGRLRLDYWNSDGTPAFCGNGSRCAALWARSRGWVKGGRFTLETSRGPLEVRITGDHRAEVSMPDPVDLRLSLRLKALGRRRTVHYVHTGVPHAVLFVPDVGRVDVAGLGRAIRADAAFGKPGANVDFASIDRGVLSLRTYERGVEEETLACGTGVVASAFVACVLGKVGPRVPVRVRSGARLLVSFLDRVRLEGPGETVFTGEVTL